MHQALQDGTIRLRGTIPTWEKEEKSVPTYISLFNWTDQGIKNVRETVQRYERSQQLQDKHGVSLQQIYWTVGPHDLVITAEASDEESITAFLLELASAGNLRTTTLRAYDREEMSGILERLG
jgi:uncharacterized protein with GYD domain